MGIRCQPDKKIPPSGRHEAHIVMPSSSSPSLSRGIWLSRLDIWMLGLTIVIGGQYFSWNAGLEAGVLSYLTVYGLVASGYVTFCYCIAEVSAEIPFADGAYGLARCTLGFLPGFLLGCCETLEYIVYVSTSVLFLADMMVTCVPTWRGLEMWIWIGFYLSALAIQIRGQQVFWICTRVLAIVSLLIVLLYCIGSLPYTTTSLLIPSDSVNPTDTVYFIGGMQQFFHVFPLGTWFFVGVEAISLAADHTAAPAQTIPYAQVACALTLCGTGLAVLLVSISLPHAEAPRHALEALASHLLPFNAGFGLLFQNTSPLISWFSIPATYATAFGFMWCYGKLIYALGTSKLFPSTLARHSHRYQTPYVALLVGSIVSFVLCITVHAYPVLHTYLFPICMLFAFLNYIGQCLGYIRLKQQLQTSTAASTTFQSPFGIAGAVYAIVIWVIGIVSIAGYQDHQGIEVGICGALILVFTVYYYVYARHVQIFSENERKFLLGMHVAKMNALRTATKLLAPSKFGGNSTSSETPAPRRSRVGGSKISDANRKPHAPTAGGQFSSVFESEWMEIMHRTTQSQSQVHPVASSIQRPPSHDHFVTHQQAIGDDIVRPESIIVEFATRNNS